MVDYIVLPYILNETSYTGISIIIYTMYNMYKIQWNVVDYHDYGATLYFKPNNTNIQIILYVSFQALDPKNRWSPWI